MARPREFDEQKVLDRAMALFWEKGFQATSFDDLVEVTGLGRGSLAAAFGDKEQLFTRVLDHYIEKRTEQVLSMNTSGGAKEKLNVLLYGWISMTTPHSGPCGCFLSLSGVSGDAPEIARQKLLGSLGAVRTMLAGIIEEGQRSGELCANGKPDELAAFYVVVFQCIAATARAGWSAQDLHAVASQALDHIIREAD
jgi:AcrR family transcriptional regulator